MDLQLDLLRHAPELDEVLFAHAGVRLEAETLPRFLGGRQPIVF